MNTGMSCAEKIVAGLAIALLLGGFAVGGYASSTIDEAHFRPTMPSYRASLPADTVVRRIAHRKGATALGRPVLHSNNRLDEDTKDL
jgi:hypothetical protein